MSVISEFLVLGGIYYHKLIINDDSVVCYDFDGKPLIHYNYKAIVTDIRELKTTESGILLGSFKLDKDNWVYVGEDGKCITGLSANDPDGLLKTEVLVSKAYITEWYPLTEST